MEERKDSEIVYSKSIKAGKRIYYLDVKKSRNDDLYLAITESKKKVTSVEGDPQQSFVLEKHKIFLYKEDFSHFVEALDDVIGYVKSQVGEIEERKPYVPQEEYAAAPGADAAPEEEKKGLFGKIFG